MPVRGPTLGLRVRGKWACFTRPEAKAERFSYEVMTPAAARGILEAVFWKPAICWRIERIHVLAPIRFGAVRRNEVGTRIPSHGERSPAQGLSGRSLAPYYADDDRQQRQTIALRDVDYLIEAYFELTRAAGPDESPAKFIEMFQRRVSRGQRFHQPYFGCREFPCDTLAVERRVDTWLDVQTGQRLMPPDELRSEARRPLGVMLLDIGYPARRPQFFEAELAHGVLVGAGRDSLPIPGEAS